MKSRRFGRFGQEFLSRKIVRFPAWVSKENKAAVREYFAFHPLVTGEVKNKKTKRAVG